MGEIVLLFYIISFTSEQWLGYESITHLERQWWAMNGQLII